MSRRTTLLTSLSGPDPREIVRGLDRLGLAPPAADFRLDVDGEKRDGAPGWIGRWLVGARSLSAVANDGQALTFDHAGVVTLSRPDAELSAPATFEQLGGLPFELAVIGPVYPEWWDESYPTYSFSDGHVVHGWACAFRGGGFDRLVSRRWLDFGPWRKREVGDATWVEFHDLDADPATALLQAQPGWERMGISDVGGFIQSAFVYTDDVGGVYDPAERLLKVIVPGRAAVTERKMLEIAAARRDPRIRQQQAIDRTAFVFVDAANARRHLHELWLRGHECRVAGGGPERRLDDGYRPVPTPPGWTG